MRPKCALRGCGKGCKYKSFTRRGKNYYPFCGKHLNMMKLDEMAKAQLEAKLDEHCPKGNANRGIGLLLLGEAYIIVLSTIKAFGGCMECFGKGYTTVKDGEMQFCSCDRGQELEKLWV